MKKKFGFVIFGSIAYLALIITVALLLLKPGISTIKNSNQKNTSEEKALRIESIKSKYDEKEQEIKDKYKDKVEELKDKKSAKEAEQSKEFMSNQFSEKYYTLNKEIDSLQDEIWDLELSRTKEINSINSEREKEIFDVKNPSDNKIVLGVIKIVVSIIIIIMPITYIISMFNKLTHLRNLVKERWSQVDVFLKQRTDLIPNIVEAVKGYTSHEKSTLTAITDARNQALNATTKEEEINANRDLSGVVNKLFALQEDYPELKADNNFLNLQNNLKEIENNISFARRNYNKAVLFYKNKLEMFPSNIIASIFNFQPELFFTIDDDEKENPNIKFN